MLPQVCTLTDNARPRFVDRWVDLRAEADSPCIWTRGLDELPLPIAHGEGRFTAPPEVIDALQANRQVALRYIDNPNGSTANIAGICDPSGVVFGLMPHPERYTHRTHHPQWTRLPADLPPAGLKLFTNAAEYVRSRQAATV
jgi:phosphoribosylformylglycinamidine synthase